MKQMFVVSCASLGLQMKFSLKTLFTLMYWKQVANINTIHESYQNIIMHIFDELNLLKIHL